MPKHRIISFLCTMVMLLFVHANTMNAAGKQPPPKHNRQTKAQQYTAKAAAEVAFVDKQPQHRSAPTRLWNAARLYSHVRRYQSAARLYERIVNRYPTWRMADKALFRLAMHAERNFRFMAATRHYMRLVQSRRFRGSKHRANALYNAAILFEALQQYSRSAKAFHAYAIFFRNTEPRAARSLYHAARVYQKGKDTKNFLRALRSFINIYGDAPNQRSFVVQEQGMLMETYEAQGRGAPFMAKQYKQMLSIYKKHQALMRPADVRRTRHYPAKASYMLSMTQYKRFARRKLSADTLPNMWRQLTDTIKEYDHVAKQLSAGVQYGSAPWLLCTLFRIAEGKEKIAKLIRQTPPPKGAPRHKNFRSALVSSSGWKYVDLTKPLERDAIKKYKKVINAAQRLHVENDCTRQARRALSRHDPNVPLFRRMQPQLQLRVTSPLPLILTLSSRKVKR